MDFTTGDLLSALSLACTMLTALCSLLLSYLTARMNLQASDRLRRTELVGPKLCEAVSRLCVAFGQLQRDDTRSYALEKPRTVDDDVAAYRTFLSACHEVMAFVPDESLHQDVRALLLSLIESTYIVYPRHDEMFSRIMAKTVSALSGDRKKSR